MDARQATRRRFLKAGATLAGVAVSARSLSGQGEHNHGLAEPVTLATHPMAHGERSGFVNLARPVMDVGASSARYHGDRNGLSALTPLGALTGTITPADLHYVSSHGSAPPDIDPSTHRLLISGLVDRPLIYTMDELMRLPAVSRIHYIECVNNGPSHAGRTLEQMYGMIGCSEWTGVPLSVLLNEAGVRPGATWVYAEGAEAMKLGATLPMGKAMEGVLVAYGQNGEPVRPHQGFPLRLVVPGFQGKYHVKWLRRITVVDRPHMSFWEHFYWLKHGAIGTRDPDIIHTFGEGGSYFMEQGPKSVITFPSAGGRRLSGPGYYTITGLAWSGCGTVRRVEVSTDGGRSWIDAAIEEPARRIALTRFTARWTWNGQEAILQSRCTDDKGQIQPTEAEFGRFWGTSGAPHKNSIQAWRVTNEGTVLNALRSARGRDSAGVRCHCSRPGSHV